MSVRRKYCSILPCAINDEGVSVLLLGKEVDDGFSCFGGGAEDGETAEETAVRECYEETMGILGDKKQLTALLIGKAVHRVSMENDRVVIFLVQIAYDSMLPVYFNRVYTYLTHCLTPGKSIPSCPQGWMEKSEMRWVPIRDVFNTPLRKPFIGSLKAMLKQGVLAT